MTSPLTGKSETKGTLWSPCGGEFTVYVDMQSRIDGPSEDPLFGDGLTNGEKQCVKVFKLNWDKC